MRSEPSISLEWEKIMRLKNILIVVNDIEKARDFYRELFGLEVVANHGGNMVLTEGLVLQDASIWQEFLKQDIIWKNHATELYFEEKDLDGFITKLNNCKEPIQYVNKLIEYPWGQKIIRFYDLDGNLIEVSTPV